MTQQDIELLLDVHMNSTFAPSVRDPWENLANAIYPTLLADLDLVGKLRVPRREEFRGALRRRSNWP